MFGTEPTPFDVRLNVFRIPVRVHPSFWIVTALLNWDADRLDLVFIWVMCLFVSVLVHELGHALIAEAFGWRSHIVLYWCGGLAYSERYFNRSHWRDIAVSLAGPFAGFGLFFVTLTLHLLLPAQLVTFNPYLEFILSSLIVINLFWGLVNLLPVLPLDGGQVSQSLLAILRVRSPDRLARQISVLFAGVAAIVFFSVLHMRFGGVLFAMLCLQNIMELQSPRH